MSDVKIFKLSSGEEVIVKIESSDNYSFHVNDATVVVMQRDPNGSGGFGLGFIPFMAYGNGTTEIKQDAIIAICTPSDSLYREYIRITSGIQLVQSI